MYIPEKDNILNEVLGAFDFPAVPATWLPVMLTLPRAQNS